MTKPVTGATVFDGGTIGDVEDLDDNFELAYNAINDFNTFGNYLVDSGAVNAYVVTLGASLTATLAAGLPVQFKAANTNTGPSTINFNGNGPVSIINTDGSALSAGQIVTGGVYSLQYDGVKWQLQSPSTAGKNTLGTPVNAAGQTFIDFLNIPVGTRRITVNYVGASTNGVSQFMIQIGDIGGIESAGYESTAASFSTAGASNSGFILTQNNNASSSISGAINLTLENAASFIWCASGVLMDAANLTSQVSGGFKGLSNMLDRIRITTAGGVDTFDAGQFNILYSA